MTKLNNSTSAAANPVRPGHDRNPAHFALVLVGVFLAYLAIPLIGSEYWFNAVLIPFLVLSLAALGLNIVTGYAGQISLGSAAFMAIGAFATYNFSLRAPGLSIVVSLLLGGGVAALAGAAFGLPSLRSPS